MGEFESPPFPGLWDFRTCPWFPKQTILIFGDTKIFELIQEKSRIIFNIMISGNLKALEIDILKVLEQRGRWIPKIRLICFWESWIRDQYQSKIMKWTFGNMGAISSKKHEWQLGNMGSIFIKNMTWIFESLKLWHQETKKSRNRATNIFSFKGIPTTLNIPTLIAAPAPLKQFIMHRKSCNFRPKECHLQKTRFTDKGFVRHQERTSHGLSQIWS